MTPNRLQHRPIDTGQPPAVVLDIAEQPPAQLVEIEDPGDKAPVMLEHRPFGHTDPRPWQHKGQAIRLDLKVVPNAKADTVEGVIHDADGRPRLALRLKAPPVDGKANAAVIAFLAKQLGCPRATLAITSGSTSRQKRITWTHPPPDAEARLQRLAEETK